MCTNIEKNGPLEKKVLETFFEISPKVNLSSHIKYILKMCVHFISDEILYFLYNRLCLKKTNILIYLKCIQWTKRGMIDFKLTSKLLLEHGDLSTLEKYEIACSICSEQIIRRYAEGLSIHDKGFLDKYGNFEKFHLMTYWTLHIGNRNKEKFFRNCLRSEGKYGSPENIYMLEWSYIARNEVAVQHFVEKNGNIIQNGLLYLINMSVQNEHSLRFFPILFDKLKPIQRERLFKNEGYKILETMLTNWRSRPYFNQLVGCVLNFIQIMNSTQSIKTIILCRKRDIIKREICKELLHESVSRLKKRDVEYIFPFIIEELFQLNSMETLEILVKKNNAASNWAIITSAFGTDICYNLIISEKLKQFEIFISLMFEEEIDLISLKIEFYGNYAYKIISSLVHSGRCEFIAEFLTHFKNCEEIKEIKLKMPYKNRGTIIRSLFKCSSYDAKVQLNNLNTFIQWSLDKKQMISNFKKEMFHNPHYAKVEDQLFQLMCELIKNRKFLIASDCLNWVFNERKISQFKSNVFKKEKVLNNCQSNGNYEPFNDFLNFLYENSQ